MKGIQREWVKEDNFYLVLIKINALLQNRSNPNIDKSKTKK